MVTLTEELLLKTAKSETLSSITHLNLHGNGLTKLKHIQSLVSLKKLIVSFNELTRLDEITHMVGSVTAIVHSILSGDKQWPHFVLVFALGYVSQSVGKSEV